MGVQPSIEPFAAGFTDTVIFLRTPSSGAHGAAINRAPCQNLLAPKLISEICELGTSTPVASIGGAQLDPPSLEKLIAG